MTEPTCKGCRFWSQWPDPKKDRGQCRRQAPAARIHTDPIEAPAVVEAYWPMTWSDDWCGEFKLRGTRSRFGEVDAGYV